MIPAQAVEAAARVLRAQDDTLTYPYPVAEYMEEAKAILEAAAPHMLAAARDDDDDAWDSNRVAIGANPFRPTP